MTDPRPPTQSNRRTTLVAFGKQTWAALGEGFAGYAHGEVGTVPAAGGVSVLLGLESRADFTAFIGERRVAGEQ